MKNRTWKKKLAVFNFLLLAAVQAAGCGQKTEKDAGTPEQQTVVKSDIQDEGENTPVSVGYREENLQLPDNVADILAVREAAGTVWMVTDGVVYFSKDGGETWEPDEVKTAAMPEACTAAAVSSQGTIAFASEDGKLLMQKSDGTQVSADSGFQDGGVCYTLEFADENILLAADTGSNIHIIDSSKESLTGTVAAEGEYHYLAVPVGGEILTLTGEGVKYYGYQGEMQDGNEVVNSLLAQDIADFNSGKGGVLIQDLEENGFYYACKRGLYHYTLGGSITEQFIEGVSNSMGDSECSFYRMAALSDRTFLIVYRKGSSEIELKKYVFSEKTEREDDDSGTNALEGDLTVYTLYKNALLEQEINAINRENPDSTVSIEVGLTDEAGLTADDAVKALNTEILAGNGPDIIIMDGMPVEQYCESGLLADLSGVLSEAAKAEGIYENIASAYEKDGAVYAVPARFQFPVMIGEEKKLAQITDLDSLVDVVRTLKEQHPEQASITGLYDEGLLEYLFDFCAPSWISSSGEIDADRLKTFLKDVKAIEDIQKEGVNDADREAVMEGYVYSDDNAELDQPVEVTAGRQSLAFYLSKSLNFSRLLLDNIQDTAYGFDGSRGQSANVFIPREIIGINAKGQNQSAAAAFVKEFLSSACQTAFHIEDTAYPVNRAAFWSKAESELQAAPDYGLDSEVCKAGFDKIQSIVEKLSVCSVTDTVIRDAVVEQGMLCLKGEASLDEAVDGIVQKVSLHMAE